jgi:hypothetical protein
MVCSVKKTYLAVFTPSREVFLKSQDAFSRIGVEKDYFSILKSDVKNKRKHVIVREHLDAFVFTNKVNIAYFEELKDRVIELNDISQRIYYELLEVFKNDSELSMALAHFSNRGKQAWNTYLSSDLFLPDSFKVQFSVSSKMVEFILIGRKFLAIFLANKSIKLTHYKFEDLCLEMRFNKKGALCVAGL